MNEQELRSLVREAIERHLGRPSPPNRRGGLPLPAEASSQRHASHVMLKVVPGSEGEDGMCVIEPAVRCSHCGFCQSYGH